MKRVNHEEACSLEEVLEHGTPFPSGLFWLHRGEDSPFPSVSRLLIRAEEKGVEAALVRAEYEEEPFSVTLDAPGAETLRQSEARSQTGM